MKLTITTHLWFPKLREIVRSWFDFTVDLAGLGFDDEDLNLDLTAGRD
jgi:hypothetical protein